MHRIHMCKCIIIYNIYWHGSIYACVYMYVCLCVSACLLFMCACVLCTCKCGLRVPARGTPQVEHRIYDGEKMNRNCRNKRKSPAPIIASDRVPNNGCLFCHGPQAPAHRPRPRRRRARLVADFSGSRSARLRWIGDTEGGFSRTPFTNERTNERPNERTNERTKNHRAG